MRKNYQYQEVERTVNLTLFVSLAITLSIFDNLIPINFLIPGMKLGIANLVIVLLLPYYSFRELLLIQILRITITAFIFGLFSVYFFSLAGGINALVLMYIAKQIFKTKITVHTLSVIGAVAHNLGQISFAIYYFKTPELIYYIPFLVLFASITGLCLGIIIAKVSPHLEGKFDVRD